MRKQYKNYLNIHPNLPDPIERRHNIIKEPLYKGTPLPKTVEYEDIDQAMAEWVEKELQISFEGKNLPTMTQYSGQRFSEYLQTWQYTDNNNNILLNFKTINRENNPSGGNQQGSYANIPGEPRFIMAREVVSEEEGKKYLLDYLMKQPWCIDLKYRVNIVCNKMALLNEFNMIVNNAFKAKQAYIAPNGYYMSMVLDSVSDESKYSVDDRQFFNQSFSITLRGYIIRKEDFLVRETELLGATIMEGSVGQKGKLVSLYPDIPKCPVEKEDTHLYETLKVKFEICDSEKVTFNTKDNNLIIYDYNFVNIHYFMISINDGEWKKYYENPPLGLKLFLPENTEIKIIGKRKNVLDEGEILFYTFDKNKAVPDIGDDGIREIKKEEGTI